MKKEKTDYRRFCIVLGLFGFAFFYFFGTFLNDNFRQIIPVFFIGLLVLFFIDIMVGCRNE